MNQTNLSILIVEDDQLIRMLVNELLKPYFQTIFLAGNGREGIEKFKKHKPDIILSDIMMPEMDGLEMIGKLKAQYPNIPVVVMSAYTDASYFVETIELGVDSYIIKPIKKELLFKALEKIIHSIEYEKSTNQQHQHLEKIIKERTDELLSLNEEYESLNEELTESNNELAIHKEKLEELVEIRTNEVKEKEIQFSTLLKTIDMIAVILDNQGNVIFANDFLLQLTGWRENEVMGNNWFQQFLPTEIQQHVYDVFLNSMLPGMLPIHYENEIITRTGKRLNIAWTNNPSYNKRKFISVTSIGLDITYRVQAENELRMAASIYSNIQVGIHIYDLEDINDDRSLRMILANDASEKLTGVKSIDVIGKLIDESFPNLREKNIPQIYADVVRTGKYFEMEDLYYKDEAIDGAFAIKAFPLENNRMGVAFENITRRKQNEQELLHTRNYLNSIFTVAPVGIGIIINRAFTFVNKRLEEITGYSSKELIGKSSRMLYGKEEEFINAGKKIEEIEHSNNIVSLETQWKTKQGSSRNIFIHATLLNSENKGQGIIFTALDISQLKETEKQLIVERDFSKMIAETSPIGIATLNAEGSIIFANKRAEEILGISKSEITKKSYDAPEWHIRSISGKPLPTEELPFMKALKTKKNITDFRHAIVWPNNETKIISVNASPVFEDGKVVNVITTIEDITKQTNNELELEQYRKHLEKLVKSRTKELENSNTDLLTLNEEYQAINEELTALNEELDGQKKEIEQTLKKLYETQSKLVQSEKMASIGILTAGIAHEINNPVNFINSGVIALEKIITDLNILLKKYDEIDTANIADKLAEINQLKEEIEFQQLHVSIEKMITNIKIGVERAVEIINSLREFARKDSGKKTPYDINKGIESTLIILKNLYKERIEIVRDFAQLTPVDCYPGQINQVFMNILTNAIQSISGKGSITIKTWKNARDKQICISVKDTGSGIPKEIIDKIFDPFFTTKEIGKGTGLGLSLSYKMIEDHKGFIRVSSEPGIGTEFIITLPL